VHIVGGKTLGFSFTVRSFFTDFHAGNLPDRRRRLGTRHQVRHLATQRDDGRIRLAANPGFFRWASLAICSLTRSRNRLIFIVIASRLDGAPLAIRSSPS